MDIELTKQETLFRKLMIILTISFLVGMALFAILPDHMIRFVNWAGDAFNMLKPIVPSQLTISQDIWDNNIAKNIETRQFHFGIKNVPGSRMYSSMAVAMMGMFAFIALLNVINPRKFMVYIPVLLVGLFVSSVAGLGYFYNDTEYRYLSDLVVAIFNLPMFLVVLVFWLMARSAAKELE